jgi:hypothetical protein
MKGICTMSKASTSLGNTKMENSRTPISRLLLAALNSVQPVGTYNEALLPCMQAIYPDWTHKDVQIELDYLEERGLVIVKRDEMNRWFARLSLYGEDVAEYKVKCDFGIARNQELQKFAEALVQDGKLLPSNKAAVVELMSALP